jgi:hypothetical protein
VPWQQHRAGEVMLVDITTKLVADAINAGIDAGKPISISDAGVIVARKAQQIRSLPGMLNLDTLDLAAAVAAHDALNLTASQGLALVQAALKFDDSNGGN